ncbi:bacteriophage recombination protein [Escherichia coli]|nr:bacteriophage recombination protein [Escherichia coli]
MSTALATLAGKLAERVGMDSVDPQELITTLRQTAFKGDASDAQFIALLIVANQYGLNPWTKEIYAFPDKQNGIVPVVGVDGWSASSMKTSSLMAWTLSRTMNPVHAGFTARTVIIRSALPNGWMNAAANHSKPAKAEKSRGRGSRIPNGCYGIKP